MLRGHRIADRFDRLPNEFGKNGPVDETDAGAVLGEWRRCLRLWADYSPEEVFALKWGAALLGAVAVGLWIVIGAVG